MRVCRTRRGQLGLALLLALGASARSAHAVVSINITSATSAPGSTVTFQVRLSGGGAQVGGVENTITFDPLTPIASCVVQPFLFPQWNPTNNFQPQGCTPLVDCGQVKFLLIMSQLGAPMPDGVLYQCEVRIAPNAVEDSYPLVCSGERATDPSGGPLDVQCADAAIQVVGPTLPPTATPTQTPTPTITPTPGPSGGGGGGGCRIAATGRIDVGWLLLFPAAALLWVRRRR
jgi:hypothetical protein